VVDERQEPESKVWSDEKDVREYLQKKMADLKAKSTATLKEQGFDEGHVHFEEYLNLRYRGTESALMIIKPTKEEADKEFDGDDWAFGKAFVKQHDQEFGFTLPDRDIIVDDVRARGIGKTFEGLEKSVDQQLKEIKPKDVTGDAKRYDSRKVFFEGGRQDTSIYKLEDLEVGDRIKGPAIIADGTQTIVVTPGASALVINTHVIINIGEHDSMEKEVSLKEVDPILLSIFAHRFMAIAEQMGRALQKTSVSTNVKERLDYSCALFDAEGGLVANGKMIYRVCSNILLTNVQRPICRSISAVCRHASASKPPSGRASSSAVTSSFPTIPCSVAPIYRISLASRPHSPATTSSFTSRRVRITQTSVASCPVPCLRRRRSFSKKVQPSSPRS
jgi:5-oxoprolinase (ATP-hydrolysing)